ncbi:MAG: DUF5752 family protein [Nanoarchaeota archaeon]
MKSKKTVNKKNPIKKRIPQNKKFVLADGKIISNIKELAMEIENMQDNIFYHHVNENKNDFANWIKDVIKEIKLAENLMTIKEKQEFELKLLKHIVKNI